MRAVQSSEVVEAFPFVEFSLQINVAFVAEKLIELLLIGTVRSLDFTIELRRAPFDVGVPDPEIFDMPMEFGLELMTIIRAHLANAEWKLFDDMINEVDGVEPPPLKWSAPIVRKAEDLRWPLRDQSPKRLS